MQTNRSWVLTTEQTAQQRASQVTVALMVLTKEVRLSQIQSMPTRYF
jgi:hypothetical protein